MAGLFVYRNFVVRRTSTMLSSGATAETAPFFRSVKVPAFATNFISSSSRGKKFTLGGNQSIIAPVGRCDRSLIIT